MFKDGNMMLDRQPKKSNSGDLSVLVQFLVVRLETQNELTCFFKIMFPK